MSKGASYALAAVVVVLLGGAGVYAYVTAPTKAPSTVVGTQPQMDHAGMVMDNGQMMATNTDQTAMMMASGTMMMAPLADGKYHIVPEQSTASFSLEEDLRGNHITVLGTTNQVTGAIKVDRTNLTTAQFDPIRINARTFVTDSEQRNNAIRRMILKTEDDANEYIEFTPKSVTGVPAKAELGQSFTFKVTGDLRVSGTTKEVTFDGTGSFTTEDQIAGTAQTKVHYPDFGVSVPNLPFLANVDQDTTLKIDFVAKK